MESLSAVYIHLVFSTKDRRPFLRDKPTRDALHSYPGGVSKQLDCRRRGTKYVVVADDVVDVHDTSEVLFRQCVNIDPQVHRAWNEDAFRQRAGLLQVRT